MDEGGPCAKARSSGKLEGSGDLIFGQRRWRWGQRGRLRCHAELDSDARLTGGVGERGPSGPSVEVKAIAETKIKIDKIDARVLAHLLRADLLPEAYVASPLAREVRSLLRQRMLQVWVGTMVKERIRGMLDRYLGAQPSRRNEDLFGTNGMAWLHEVEVKATDRQMLDEGLKLLEELHQHIAASEGLVRELARDDGCAELLKTICGIGNFFSVLITYEVDEISRFAQEDKLFSYRFRRPTPPGAQSSVTG